MKNLDTITSQIDVIAKEIQDQDPSIALALDRVSDGLEKQATVTEWIKGLKDILKKNDIPETKQKKKNLPV